MKILLVYPRYPDTFWSFKHALKFASKKAAFPPLGLLTIAAMLPRDWDKKLVDMNINKLNDEDIVWADYVFISAMITQKASAKEVISRCNKLGTKVVAGGPVFTTGYEEFDDVDHFVLGEAEATLPPFLEHLSNGCAQQIYDSEERPDITQTPAPLWDLIDVNQYAAMAVQYSRGCPFNCEFCDIIVMNGRTPRTKRTSQLLREFTAIYRTGFRGSLFIVDDNFIGNKPKVKKMLPKIIRWQQKAGYPFLLLTEASLNLADDEDLMRMMAKAGFDRVFIGLETPVAQSLEECDKVQNEGRDMAIAVRTIQNHGMQVMGGFIVGFDSDPPSVFDSQIKFIQEMGVVTAMVGILTALPKTRLYNRLKSEDRLLTTSSGNNADGSVNFIPKMNAELLTDGYERIVRTIYSPQMYYARIGTFLDEYRPARVKRRRVYPWELRAFFKSVWHLGIASNSRGHYWKFLAKATFKYPRAFPEAVELSIFGFHFRKIAEQLQPSPATEQE